ncbi:hypothetical protein RND71_036968 [Anisodus tanguticus]|uniref:Uncharacterized protein n=1 Tax=Anisodus tanguticus TaxID=243964 RepID=A0AAE1R1G1_9SOLA|nr:hypothetical protein RND71_036968 [Anisodus tanguticus]
MEGEEGLLPGGPEPSVRYHSGRARILTLCQDLRAKGQSQGILQISHVVGASKKACSFRTAIVAEPNKIAITTQELRRKGKACQAVCPRVQDSSKKRRLTRRPGTLA